VAALLKPGWLCQKLEDEGSDLRILDSGKSSDLDNLFHLIEKIHNEGRLAIIAHPNRYQDNITTDLIKLVDGIK